MTPTYLSYFLDESTPAYGGSEGTIVLKKCREISKGDTSNNLELGLPAHIGTHIDFPYHLSNEGKKCQDYPAAFWLFSKVGFLSCSVKELEHRIVEHPTDIEILLFRSGFGAKRGLLEYWASQPVIPARYATLLRERFPQLRVFGFDMISLTSKLDRSEGKAAHISFLLEQEILVLEDMNLIDLNEVPGKVVVQPLQVRDADGVPCSVIGYH
jgi:arylformamidase